MAVTITAPASRVAGRSGPLHVAWEAEYPQSAYEILYRRKGADTWSTFGRVEGTANSAEVDLDALEDFAEYHYRVVCYSEAAAEGDALYSGHDASAAYSLVVVPAQRLATARARYGGEMLEVPVYPEEAAVEGVRVALEDGAVGVIALGAPEDPLASGLRLESGEGVRAALGEEARFLDSGVAAEADMAVSQRYRYSYAKPTYQYSYRYSYTKPTYKYLYYYSYVGPSTYYYYKTSAAAYGYKSGTYYYAQYSYTKDTYVAGYSGGTRYYYYLDSEAIPTPIPYQYTTTETGYYAYSIPPPPGGALITKYGTYQYNATHTGYFMGTVGTRYYYSMGSERYYTPYYGYYYYRAYGYTSGTYYYKYSYTKYYYAVFDMGGGMEGGSGYATGGGGTGYAYRYSTGGGGTGYGYRYTTTHKYQ